MVKSRRKTAFGVVLSAVTLLLPFAAGQTAAAAPPEKLTWRQAADHNLTLMAAGASPTTSRLRVAAEPGPSTWTHNISGNRMWWDDRVLGRPDKSVWPLKFAIASQPDLPLVIGIQEACHSQAAELLQWLQANKNPNYRMNFRQQNECSHTTANGVTHKDRYGTAVFVIGNAGPSNGTFWKQDPAPFAERRGYVCLRSVYLYTGCTAHMSNAGEGHNNSPAIEQFQEMYGKALEIKRDTGSPVFWGGDFYMTPSGIRALYGDDFFTNNPEGDMTCTPDWDNTLGNTKVDYVFRTKPVTCSKDAVVHMDPHYSDHAMLGGYL
jgi:hypothetical protein